MSPLHRTWALPVLIALSLSPGRAQSTLPSAPSALLLPSGQTAPAAPSAPQPQTSSSQSAAQQPTDQPPPPRPEKLTLAKDVAGIDFPSVSERRKSYLYDLIGPRAFLGAAASAAFDQGSALKVGYPPDGFPGPGLHPAHGVVPEWGEGLIGYGKRFGSEFGTGFVSVSAKYALGDALHEDVTYHACDCAGRPVHRFIHLFAGSFASRTRHGRAVPSLPIFLSPFIASEAAVHIWYPSRFNASDALRISLSPLYTLPIRNLIAEYAGK